VPADASPRIGAYTAGELLRTVGGEAYIVSVDESHAETILSIPLILGEPSP
jgi:hypothetical protein